MNVQETMELATVGGRAIYEAFNQTEVLGEAACWSLSLKWINRERHGKDLLEKLRDPN
jgi:hypothetical protein